MIPELERIFRRVNWRYAKNMSFQDYGRLKIMAQMRAVATKNVPLSGWLKTPATTALFYKARKRRAAPASLDKRTGNKVYQVTKRWWIGGTPLYPQKKDFRRI